MQIFNEEIGRRNLSLFPLAWLAAAFAGGILTAKFVEIHFAAWLSLIAAASLVAAFRLKHLPSASAFALSAFFFAGAFSLEIERQAIAPNRLQTIYDAGEIDSKTPLVIAGYLQSEPEQSVGGAFLVVQAEKINFNNTERTASGAVRVFVPLNTTEDEIYYQKLDLHYGAVIETATVVTREDRFRNLGYTPFRASLAGNDLDASAALKNPRQIERLGERGVFLPLRWLYGWRENLVRQFRANFSPPTAGVLIASLVGNRYFLSKETAERFRAGGTFHILVISGFQITLIGALMAWFVRRFTKNSVAQFLIANSLLWTYSLMVGADAPVTRAALMFTIFHGALLFARQASPLNSLGASALVLLALRPADFFDQSFQLTFISVFALVGGAFPFLEKLRQIGAWQPSSATPAPPICSRRLKTFCEILFWSENDWQRNQRRTVWQCKLFKSRRAVRLEKSGLQPFWRFAFASVAVSAIVQIWLAPLMILYFHRFSFAGLLLNLFVGALIAAESFAAIGVLLVSAINQTVALPLVWLCELLNWLITYSVEPFSALSLASFRLPNYAGSLRLIYLVYFFPLIWLAAALHRWNVFQINRRKRFPNSLAFAAQGILLALILFHPFSEPPSDGRLHVDFLDVGQGDAVLLTMPNGATLLIDGGGRPQFGAQTVANEFGETETFTPDSRSIGEAVVCEYLWQKGYSHVDFLLPTHADADHIDGLNDVAENFAVTAALAGRTPLKRREFAEFYTNLVRRQIPLTKISRGESFQIGGAAFEVLHPAADDRDDADSTNNDSVVLRVSYGSRRFLLTGDAEAKAERLLLEKPETLAADVVKAAHHGSKTSSIENFVRATSAKFVVVSVGRDSPYNHPHREVIERWRGANAEILTTGERGTISFSTDGNDLKLETFVQN